MTEINPEHRTQLSTIVEILSSTCTTLRSLQDTTRSPVFGSWLAEQLVQYDAISEQCSHTIGNAWEMIRALGGLPLTFTDTERGSKHTVVVHHAPFYDVAEDRWTLSLSPEPLEEGRSYDGIQSTTTEMVEAFADVSWPEPHI